MKSEKSTIFNFRDKESQEAFTNYNDKNVKLISHEKDSQDIVSGGRKWFSELKDSINKSFKKIRISNSRKLKVLLQLIEQKTHLSKDKEFEECKNRFEKS